MNRAIARALLAGTLTGVSLCAAASVAHLAGLAVGAHLARLGVLALFLTPPLRLAVTAGGFFAAGERRLGAAALAVLAALLAVAANAALR